MPKTLNARQHKEASKMLHYGLDLDQIADVLQRGKEVIEFTLRFEIKVMEGR